LGFETPVSTEGVVRLPVMGTEAGTVITVNGKVLGKEQYRQEMGHIVLELSGGKYDIVVTQQ
jgi:hypothetical protein